MGTINGVPAHEYSIETTEEKPWLKPGSDITGKVPIIFDIIIKNIYIKHLTILFY